MKQGKASFSNLLQFLSMDGLDASVKDVLYIERQALLQLAISRFAELFDPARYENYRQVRLLIVILFFARKMYFFAGHNCKHGDRN